MYVDLRLLVSRPNLMQDAACAYARKLDFLECDRIAGIPYAALPIGMAVSLASGVPLIYNRKESKSHGLGKDIEGLWQPGERVVIIEDVITTGGSIVSSVELFPRGRAGRRGRGRAAGQAAGRRRKPAQGRHSRSQRLGARRSTGPPCQNRPHSRRRFVRRCSLPHLPVTAQRNLMGRLKVTQIE